MVSDYVNVARISSTHGLRGEVKIYPIVTPPDLMCQLKTLFLKTSNNSWQKVSINKLRPYKKELWLLDVNEWTTIEDAEAFIGSDFFVPKADLPPLPTDTYYIGDLIGCEVRKDTGEVVGELFDVLETGANDIYVIRTIDGKELLLPAVKEFILKICLDKKLIVVSIPVGLEEL